MFLCSYGKNPGKFFTFVRSYKILGKDIVVYPSISLHEIIILPPKNVTY